MRYNELMGEDYYVLAAASLGLGVLSLCLGGWALPICGLPLSILGVVLGTLGRRSSYPNVASAGVVMSVLGLVLTIVTGLLIAYAGVARLFQG